MAASRIFFVSMAVALMGLSNHAMAKDFTVKVAGTAMPWTIKKVNPNLPFGKNDGTPPATNPDLHLTAGTALKITATGSTTTVAGGGGFDPNGQQAFICNDQLGGSGMPFPSMYMNHGFYPVHLNELAAVFTDAKGKIVKSPFPIGSQMTITVPEGAVFIQFGLNDDIYADNTGEIDVVISTPDP
jgi:hypothetical protein